MTSLLDEGTAVVRAVRHDPTARRRALTVMAITLITAQLILRAWAVWGSWFFGDDFVFLADVARGQADAEWFFHRHNLHFMPGSFALVVPVAAAGVYAWHVAAVEMIVFQAAASLACWWMLRTLFGNRAMILVPLTIYLFSVVTIPSLMWWAAGVNSIAVQPFMFGAIGLHVLMLRTGQRRFALGAALCVLLALLFYVKALLIAPVLAVLAVCYAARGPLPRRIWSLLLRFRLAWTLYALSGVAYLIAYFTLPAESSPAGKVDYVDLADTFVVKNLSTALFGGPWSWLEIGGEAGPRQLADPPQVAWIICLLVLGGAVVLLVAHYKGALQPLWFVVPYVLVTAGLLGYGRAGVFKITSAEIRYWADFMPVLTLAVALSLMPLRGLPAVLVRRPVSLMSRRVAHRILAGYLVVFVAGSIASTLGYVKPWHQDFDARRYLTTAQQDLESRSTPVPLADQAVPGPVMPALFDPYNLPRLLLSPLATRFTTPDVATDMQVLDDNGSIKPGFASPDFTVASHRLARCLQGGAESQHIAFGSATYDFPFWLSMSYRSDTSTEIGLVVGTKHYDARLEAGTHTLSLRTEGSNDRIVFDLPSGARLCVNTLNIGTWMEPR